MTDTFKAFEWRDNTLYLLDQRALPDKEQYLECKDLDAVIDAIKEMVVRGAPAIGIAAAYGVVLCARHHYQRDKKNWREAMLPDLESLIQARPTAVNLAWSVKKMRHCLSGLDSVSDPVISLLRHADEILEQDIVNNFAMAELACDILEQNNRGVFSVLTHCNAGALATGGYGTALGVIQSAWQRGLIDRVYVDETRPWLQGARLTTWELQKAGVPIFLNVDGAAAWLMSEKNIAWVIVGADRITANGDVANKIGTYSLAVLARYHGLKMMVVAPSSTVDMATPDGQAIEIEMRSGQELTHLGEELIAPENTEAINPVFDVTPACLIDAIVTEKGVVKKPCLALMKALFQ